MTRLETLYKQIQKEKNRIELLRTTKGLDVDFMRSEIENAKNKIIDIQKEFDKEYEYQNS